MFEPRDYSQSISRQILVRVQKKKKKKLSPPNMTTWSVVYDQAPSPSSHLGEYVYHLYQVLKKAEKSLQIGGRIGVQTARDRVMKIHVL